MNDDDFDNDTNVKFTFKNGNWITYKSDDILEDKKAIIDASNKNTKLLLLRNNLIINIDDISLIYFKSHEQM